MSKTVIKLKVRNIFFECCRSSGECRITLPKGKQIEESNPRIAFIKFMQHVEYDLLERFLDCMEENGFDRYTGKKVELKEETYNDNTGGNCNNCNNHSSF